MSETEYRVIVNKMRALDLCP